MRAIVGYAVAALAVADKADFFDRAWSASKHVMEVFINEATDPRKRSIASVRLTDLQNFGRGMDKDKVFKLR
jgi:hypothetical protein